MSPRFSWNQTSPPAPYRSITRMLGVFGRKVLRVIWSSKGHVGQAVPDLGTFEKSHINWARLVTVTCMGFREGNNSTGLAAAVGVGRMSTFRNIEISDIYPTCPWILRNENVQQKQCLKYRTPFQAPWKNSETRK